MVSSTRVGTMAATTHSGSPRSPKGLACYWRWDVNISWMNEGHRKAFPLHAELSFLLPPSTWLHIMQLLTVSWVSRSPAFNFHGYNIDSNLLFLLSLNTSSCSFSFFIFVRTSRNIITLILHVAKIRQKDLNKFHWQLMQKPESQDWFPNS